MNEQDRKQVLSRDGHKCRNCGREEKLQVHHIVPLNGAGNDTPSNCITVCDACHDSIHQSAPQQQNTLEGLRAAEAAGKWVGRPPYGFTTDDDGYLQPTDEFGDARDAILAVEEEGWSHRKAARHTGVPRRTVPNLLEKRKLYLNGFSPNKPPEENDEA